MDRATATSKMREKINLVTGGEGLEVRNFDSRFSRIYYTELHELPDSVRNYPEPCQRAYLVTFNNNLRRYKLHGYAMSAAWKALQNRHEKWLHDEREAKRSRPTAADVAYEIFDKAKPLRPQIVVA